MSHPERDEQGNGREREETGRERPGGDVVPFPGARQGPGAEVELAAEVLEGELVSEEDYTRRRVALARYVPVVVHLVTVVRESERTAHLKALAAYRVRQVPRDVVRLGWFALRGHGRWITKGWTWATYGQLRAEARAAQMARDALARREAQELIRVAAAARRQAALRVLVVSVAVGVVAGIIGLALVILASVLERAEMPGWLAGIYTALDGVGAVLAWVPPVVLVGVLVAAVVEGRDKTPGVGFLVRPGREGTDVESWVDERMISTALAHLGIAPLDKFFKAGGELVYTVPARVDGDGTYAQIRLPLGLTAEMVAAQRAKLAANLGRASLETWPTQGDEAGILDLWVADKGKLGGGAGQWPLLHDGTVDVFEGVPIGRSQRGTVINAPLFESNWLIGGRPGQGKSAAMRTLLLGAALDPTVELWVFVMGQSPDFAPFQPRLSRYRMGMDDAVAEAALQGLQDLLTEMERRGKVLGQQRGSPPKISRKLADTPGLGLHPLVCSIDECHELFMHPTYGKHAAELAIRLIKRGRKYGLILVLATQSPTADSIPKEVTRNVSAGVAFAVSDHVANDGLLGGGKYRAGIRATDLRMKTDRGTSVAVGITDNVFELLRWFYIPFEDGHDAVTPVIARAMGEIGELRRTGPDLTGIGAPTEVDHLADIAGVLRGERRVRTQVVLGRLAELNPGEYEDWSFSDLTAALSKHDIEVAKSDGVKVVRAEDVTRALTERDRDDDDET